MITRLVHYCTCAVSTCGGIFTLTVDIACPFPPPQFVPHIVKNDDGNEDGGEDDEQHGHDKRLPVHGAHHEVRGRIGEDGSLAGITAIRAGTV